MSAVPGSSSMRRRCACSRPAASGRCGGARQHSELGRSHFMWRERRRFKTLAPANKPLVASHFLLKTLLGRTVVVSAVKAEKAG